MHQIESSSRGERSARNKAHKAQLELEVEKQKQKLRKLKQENEQEKKERKYRSTLKKLDRL